MTILLVKITINKFFPRLVSLIVLKMLRSKLIHWSMTFFRLIKEAEDGPKKKNNLKLNLPIRKDPYVDFLQIPLLKPNSDD